SLQADERPVLLADLCQAVVANQMTQTPRTRAEFDRLNDHVRGNVFIDGNALWQQLEPALQQWRQLKKQLGKGLSLQAMTAANDIQEQLDHLVYAGFISHLRNPLADGKHLKRYLAAVAHRLNKLKTDGAAADKQR